MFLVEVKWCTESRQKLLIQHFTSGSRAIWIKTASSPYTAQKSWVAKQHFKLPERHYAGEVEIAVYLSRFIMVQSLSSNRTDDHRFAAKIRGVFESIIMHYISVNIITQRFSFRSTKRICSRSKVKMLNRPKMFTVIWIHACCKHKPKFVLFNPKAFLRK